MSARTTGEIAIVDDDRRVVSLLCSIFEGDGHHTGVAYSAEQALRLFGEQDFDMAFIDYRLPGKDGLDLLRELKARWPETEVVMITGEGNIEVAVEAMKLGACEFMSKPFTVDLIRLTAGKVLEKCRLRKQNEYRKSSYERPFPPDQDRRGGRRKRFDNRRDGLWERGRRPNHPPDECPQG